MSDPRPVTVRPASPVELAQWDETVRRFPNHRIAHLRAWSTSLEACGCGTPLYLLFGRGADIVGCLPGLLTHAGPLTLFGSPRVGWQTVSMGPAYDSSRVTTAELMDALVPWLEHEAGCRHIELMHTELDPGAMHAAGFEGQPVFTYRARLFPDDPKRAFKALKDSARRNVQRAVRLGLKLQFTENESFVDEHYAQLCEVYVRNGTAIPFSKERILACFRHLRDAGNLLAVSVFLPSGRVNIATGMFFVEGRELSLWMWAHRERYRWYRPTELMTWTVMERAMARGCDTFDLMGGGVFKTKFGAEPDTAKMRWLRSRPRWLRPARRVLAAGFHAQQTLRGGTHRIAGRARRALASLRAGQGPAPACVLGDIDLVRSLGLYGIGSIVLAPEGDAARFSRHTRGTLAWNDAWAEPARSVETLIEFAESQDEPPVLFYDTDASLLMISRQRERLSLAFRYVVAGAELVENLVDKSRFQRLAGRLGLPVPAALPVRPHLDPPPGALDIAFPVVVKPFVRRRAAWTPLAGTCKAVRADSPAELRALWPRLAATGLRVLVQSLIEGPETGIESYHVYVDGKGAIAAEFTGRKIRTIPAAYGDSTALEITDAADVRALGRDIVERLGLTGVAKLDLKRAPDGRLHLLEVNPRFTLWHHLGARAGLNVPALVYGDLTGRPRPPQQKVAVGARWSKPWDDVRAARAAGLSLPAWLWWTLGCDATRAFAWDDPLPLLRAGIARLLHPRRDGRAEAPVSIDEPARSLIAEESSPPRALAALRRSG